MTSKDTKWLFFFSLTNKTNEQIEIQKDALLSRKTMARINFFDQFADNDEVIITGETSFDNNVKYSSFSGSITVNDLLEVYRKTMLDNPRIWVAIIEVNFFSVIPIGHFLGKS